MTILNIYRSCSLRDHRDEQAGLAVNQKSTGFLLQRRNPVSVTGSDPPYLVTRTSTRRFLARPASVVFGAFGLVSAYP